jgi:hypothetical protein
MLQLKNTLIFINMHFLRIVNGTNIYLNMLAHK